MTDTATVPAMIAYLGGIFCGLVIAALIRTRPPPAIDQAELTRLELERSAAAMRDRAAQAMAHLASIVNRHGE